MFYAIILQMNIGDTAIDFSRVISDLDGRTTDEGLYELLYKFIKYGFVLIVNAPNNVAHGKWEKPGSACRHLCQQLAPIHPTIFGDYWSFNNVVMEHADTAYSSEALGAHTDGTYYIQAPGIQVVL